MNLSKKKGILIQSIDCVLCDRDVETMDHWFFTCSSSSDLWRKVWALWDLKSPRLTSVSSLKSLVQRMGNHHSLGAVFLWFVLLRSGRFGDGGMTSSLLMFIR